MKTELAALRNSSYREFSEVLTLVHVVPRRLASPAQLVVEPHEQVPDGLGAGDDVERRRQSAALVKVTHPQLGAGKLPLDVGVVLRDTKRWCVMENKTKHRNTLNRIQLHMFLYLLIVIRHQYLGQLLS